MKIGVDFFGPPTAGKSTLVSELAEYYNDKDIPAAAPTYTPSNEFSRTERILHKLFYTSVVCILSPFRAYKYLRLCFESDQNTASDAIRNLFSLFSTAGIIKCETSTVQLYDQGYGELITSMLLSSNTYHIPHSEFHQLLTDFDYYLIVHVQITDSELKKRLAQRKEDKSRVGSQYSVSNYRTAEERAQSFFSDCAKHCENFDYVSIENNSFDDLHTNKQHIRKVIDTVLSGQRNK